MNELMVLIGRLLGNIWRYNLDNIFFSFIDTAVKLFIWEKGIRKFYYRFKLRKCKATNDYILLISVSNNIENAKAKIISQSKNNLHHLKNLQIETIELPENCEASDIQPTLQKIIEIRKKMASVGGKFTVHLFYAGPCIMMGPIGAVMGNQDTVHIYHPDKDRNYNYWGKLKF
jgi:hypothetical protein